MRKYLKLLSEYIGFKSISTDPAYKDQILETVEWLKKLFMANGFTIEIIQGPKTNPVLVARYHQADDMQTVLVYGHYDVQPASIGDGWNTDPFTLAIREKRLFGRGVVDNKGQNLAHAVTVFDLIKSGELKYNVAFMLEGNEETGNEDMSDLVLEHKDLLKTDYILISDGEIVGENPTIEASLRGGMNACVKIFGAPNDLHSGLYGGAAPNPALIASHIISQLKDLDGQVKIPGFYEDIEGILSDQEKNLDRMPSDEEVCKMAGLKGLMCEPGISFYGQVGLRPTIEISGIASGYTGAGYKNIIPAECEFRVNFRFVPGQYSETIYFRFAEMISDIIPESVRYEITRTKPYGSVKLNTESSMQKRVQTQLKEVYGMDPLMKYVGGGIPIVLDFQEVLGIDSLLVPSGNEDCNMHGVNENFRVDLVKKALGWSRLFFSTEHMPPS